MAVTSNTGTITPVVGTEQDVATISGGPFDNLTVYVVGGTGGAGGALEFALYATVGGFRTRVAQKMIMGDNVPSIIDWDTGRGPLNLGSGGKGQTENLDVGGTDYTVTVIDLSTGPGQARAAVTVTLAGVDTFDTVGGANFGAALTIAAGATASLTVFPGYAQSMDVAIDQTNLPSVTVSVTADCGGGTVAATVIERQMGGRDETVAAVFQGIKLPIATRYFVNVTNDSSASITVVTTGITYSVTASSGGGVVTLSPDVIGPSNANEVVQWAHVPLVLVGSGTFTTPVDAAVPIYDLGANSWRAFALSGGATMTNAGVVTINAGSITLAGDVTGPANANTVVRWENQPLDPVTMGAPSLNDVPTWNGSEWVAAASGGTVTLTGNVNGPSNANRFLSLTLLGNDADVTVPEAGTVPGAGWWWVRMNGLTATRTVNLPAAPTNGEVVVVKDGDGSLATQDIAINPGGNSIDGVAGTYTMTAVQNGVQGSIQLQYDSAAPNAGWFLF